MAGAWCGWAPSPEAAVEAYLRGAIASNVVNGVRAKRACRDVGGVLDCDMEMDESRLDMNTFAIASCGFLVVAVTQDPGAGHCRRPILMLVIDISKAVPPYGWGLAMTGDESVLAALPTAAACGLDLGKFI